MASTRVLMPAPECHGPGAIAEQALAKLSATQRRLLPQRAPDIPGYRLELIYRPSYFTTGDYHDFFEESARGPALFIGDASGHGPAACMISSAVRTLFRAQPCIHRNPGETLTQLGSLCHSLLPPDLFMTGIYMVLGEGGQVSWASAGHDPPLRITRCGRVLPVDLSRNGLPLGIEGHEIYHTVRWQMGYGERLLLFTDGLVESRNGTQQSFGRRQFQAFAAQMARVPLKVTVEAIVERVASHLDGAAFEDDFTLLGIECVQEGDN